MHLLDFTQLYVALILGAATATASLTITRTYIFKTPRKWFRKRGVWFDKLFTCPYCMSHYVAAFFMLFYTPRVVRSRWYAIDYMVSWLLLVVVSALLVGLLWRALSQIAPPPSVEDDGAPTDYDE